MAKLPLVSSRYLIKYLAAHGFVHVHTRGSHHVLRRGTRTVVVPERAQVAGDCSWRYWRRLASVGTSFWAITIRDRPCVREMES